VWNKRGQQIAPRVLLISNTADLVTRIGIALRREDFEVLVCHDTLEGMRTIYETYPSVVIMEDRLSATHLVDLCAHVRQISCVPIILLGQEDSGSAFVRGLERGADLYMGMPVSVPELVTRVKTLLRCWVGWPESVLKFLNPEEHSVLVDNRSIRLSPTEFRLLSYLVLHRGRVVPAEELLSHVWGQEVTSDTLRSHVFRLRLKLNHSAPHKIFTHHGVGYCLGAACEPGSETSTATENGYGLEWSQLND
jgi:DNA-binding response OmpR family regulator